MCRRREFPPDGGWRELKEEYDSGFGRFCGSELCQTVTEGGTGDGGDRTTEELSGCFLSQTTGSDALRSDDAGPDGHGGGYQRGVEQRVGTGRAGAKKATRQGL